MPVQCAVALTKEKSMTANTYKVNRLIKQVDELGAVNAQIAVLQRQADDLKATLKASGYDEVIGTTFRAVISTKTTARLDSKLVRKILTPTEVDECTVESTSTSISLYDL
jgi:hypothetical protein